MIRYSPASERDSEVAARDVLGRDFFKELLPEAQLKEFQARFNLFMAQGQTIDRFSTSFNAAGGQIKVQMLLARLKSQAGDGQDRLALVRLMPEES